MAYNNIFPTRDGTAQGASEENRMLDSVGGADTIRTKIVQNLDGSETMLRTRGGHPEFTTTKKVVPPPVSRTFVFRQLGSSLAVIANRLGSGMKVLVRDLACGVVNYAVGAVKTDTQGGWRDVWRINDLDFKTNGKTPSPVTAVVPNYGPTALPYVAAYQASCTDDATRSPLFIAHGRSVASIKTDGTEKNAITASNSSYHVPQSSAGIQTDGAGEFDFYGCTIYLNNGPDVVWEADPAWSRIQASLLTPYVSEVAAGNTSVALRTYAEANSANFAVVYSHGASQGTTAYHECSVDLGNSIPRTNCSAENLSGGGSSWLYDMVATYGGSGPAPAYFQYSGSVVSYAASGADTTAIATYGYGSSLLPLSLDANVSCTYSGNQTLGSAKYGYYLGWEPTTNAYFGGGKNTTTVASSSDVTTTLTSPLGKLVDVTCHITESLETGTITGAGSPGSYYPEVASRGNMSSSEAARSAAISAWNANPAPHGMPDLQYATGQDNGASSAAGGGATTCNYSIKTVDHIFADPSEGVFLTLEANLTGVIATTISGAAVVTSSTHTFGLTLSYLLSVRGVLTTFPIYSGNSFTPPVIYSRSVFTGLAFNPGYGTYHAPLNPTPVFSPVYMNQGNCPYIAYTTKAEEAAGATPECYVDFSLLPMRYSTWAASSDNTIKFIPHHFMYLFRQYIANEARTGAWSFTQNQTMWEDLLFPTDQPFKVQFANGVQGVWQSQLGEGFTGYPSMEITRI